MDNAYFQGTYWGGSPPPFLTSIPAIKVGLMIVRKVEDNEHSPLSRALHKGALQSLRIPNYTAYYKEVFLH